MSIPIQIKSLQHPIVKHAVSLRKDKEYRKQTGTLLICSKKELMELPSHVKILTLFSLDMEPFVIPKGHHYVVTEEILKKITGLATPESYAAEIRYTPPATPHPLRKVLICEEISDPGNLGTLIRTAAAFSFDALFLLGSCVDPFNDKVIRSSKGSLFHLPLFAGDWEEFTAFIKKWDLHLYQADLQGKPCNQLKTTYPFGLVVGNEAHGTSRKMKELAEGITIPISDKIESLNVAIAGAILMFMMSQ